MKNAINQWSATNINPSQQGHSVPINNARLMTPAEFQALYMSQSAGKESSTDQRLLLLKIDSSPSSRHSRSRPFLQRNASAPTRRYASSNSIVHLDFDVSLFMISERRRIPHWTPRCLHGTAISFLLINRILTSLVVPFAMLNMYTDLLVQCKHFHARHHSYFLSIKTLLARRGGFFLRRLSHRKRHYDAQEKVKNRRRAVFDLVTLCFDGGARNVVDSGVMNTLARDRIERIGTECLATFVVRAEGIHLVLSLEMTERRTCSME